MMETNWKTSWSDEELVALREVLHLLGREARPLFSANQWNSLRRFVHQGIRNGLFGRNNYGVSRLLHSLQTAYVVLHDIGLKMPSFVTVMLYHTTEGEDGVKRETIVNTFGEDTAHLLDCMRQVKNLYAQHDDNALEDENFRKLFLSMAKDIRVIICLIAGRYVLMRLLNHSKEVEYRKRITQECRLLYTPMSHRLGLYAIKRELEDMAVKYDDRETYDRIAHGLQQTKTAREAYIKAFIEPLEKRLKDSTQLRFHIKGRTKSISSIQHKLIAQSTTLENIYDLFAIRIIIDEPDPAKEKAACWQAYS
ncbi:MAG: HD domain-containing protein, partial [Bacteroidales bacterium]|nr:HD domain-containing protein [Bacteroidales bacterium]